MSSLLIRRLLQVTAGTLAGLAVVAVLYLGPAAAPPDAQVRAGGPDEPETALPEPYPAPEFALRTVDGEPFTHEDLRDRVSVVFFGFASCTDICPITLTKLGRALDLLEPSGRTFQGLFVSVDPARDTPDALREWMSAFHPSLVALTGSSDAVERTTEAWDIHVGFHEETEGAGMHEHGEASEGAADIAGAAGNADVTASDAYAVSHTTRALVVDPRGMVTHTLPAYLTAEEMVAVLDQILDG